MVGIANGLMVVILIAMVFWVNQQLSNGNTGTAIFMIIVGVFLIGLIQSETLRDGISTGVGSFVEAVVDNFSSKEE